MKAGFVERRFSKIFHTSKLSQTVQDNSGTPISNKRDCVSPPQLRLESLHIRRQG